MKVKRSTVILAAVLLVISSSTAFKFAEENQEIEKEPSKLDNDNDAVDFGEEISIEEKTDESNREGRHIEQGE